VKRELKAVAVAVAAAVAVVVATAAANLADCAVDACKTLDSDLIGDKVLEMLCCLPVTDCDAMNSTPSLETAASAACSGTFCGKEAI
jgi:hypothetical protein